MINMTKALAGMPKQAFPCDYDRGMTLRDWFAGMVLQGLIEDGTNGTVSDGTWTYPEIRSKMSYEYADAMIAERDKNEK